MFFHGGIAVNQVGPMAGTTRLCKREMRYYNQKTWVYFNGDFVKAEQAGIDLFGQSLHYGYSAMEGIRAYSTHNGTRIFKARQHFERLRYSCDAIGIHFPWTEDALIEASYQLLQKNNLKSAYIRPLVTTGHNMYLTTGASSHIVILAWEWGPFLGSNLIRATLSPYQRPNPKSLPVNAKISGQYTASIYATNEANARGYDEAILTDSEGNIAQASSNNLFIEKNGVLYTPPPGSILEGITRRTVFELAKYLHIEAVETTISPADLLGADSAFLTGTATGIIGITSVDDTTLPLEWQDSLGSSIQRAYKSLTLEQQNFDVII